MTGIEANSYDHYKNKFSEIFGTAKKEKVENDTQNAKEIAQFAYDCMDGWGTSNEDQLQEILLSLDEDQAQAVKNEFARMTDGESITDWIRGDFSGSTEDALLKVFENPSDDKDYFDAKMVAKQAYEAMDGWGTDEATLKEIFNGLTKEQGEEVKQIYEQMYKEKLEDAIDGDTSGELNTYLKAALNGSTAKVKQEKGEDKKFDPTPLAKKAYEAMKGWGTDEDALESAIIGLNKEEAEAVKSKFQELYGESIIDWIEDDTSGDLQKRLVATFKQ